MNDTLALEFGIQAKLTKRRYADNCYTEICSYNIWPRNNYQQFRGTMYCQTQSKTTFDRWKIDQD